MALLDSYEQIIDSLTYDWTDLQFDLRVDESRYVDAALMLVVCNAQPYSNHDWHFRILVANHFGHAASVDAVRTAFGLLDRAGISGELALRETRAGRVETVQMWGRGQSIRDEFQRIHNQ